MEERNRKDNEVSLVLRDCRIVANKDALARNSLYFAALFSENFKDHQQKEFEVNYDISLSTLQTFVNWANNEGADARFVHSSKYHFDVSAPLEKFINGNHCELLDLLNLSVVFAAEALTENIADMIIRMKLHADFMLDLWLLADDLELKNLRDTAFASCLDRFEVLSLPCLLKLSKKNFFKLVLNTHINCSSNYMLFVREAWKNNNGLESNSESGENNDTPSGVKVASQPNCCIDRSGDERLSDPLEIVTNERLKKIYDRRKAQFMPCTVGRRSDNSLFVWAWNVDKREFDEIAEMTDSQMHTTVVGNGKDIVGRQVIGRAFSIYVIGGELGLGTGRFNTTLWRYCLFYKKWYIETVLPQPRRHMAVAFLKNKLYLFGGVGRHRLKLFSVDVYDIHTGIWTRAADIPETFTEVPPSCVADGKFFYNKSRAYVYDPTSDEWNYWSSDNDRNSLHIRTLLSTAFDFKYQRRFLSNELLQNIFRKDRENDSYTINQQTWNDPWIIRVGCTDDGPYVEVAYLNFNDPRECQTIPISFSASCTKLTFLPVDTFKFRHGSFNIIDPQKLYQQISSDIFKLCSE